MRRGGGGRARTRWRLAACVARAMGGQGAAPSPPSLHCPHARLATRPPKPLSSPLHSPHSHPPTHPPTYSPAHPLPPTPGGAGCSCAAGCGAARARRHPRDCLPRHVEASHARDGCGGGGSHHALVHGAPHGEEGGGGGGVRGEVGLAGAVRGVCGGAGGAGQRALGARGAPTHPPTYPHPPPLQARTELLGVIGGTYAALRPRWDAEDTAALLGWVERLVKNPWSDDDAANAAQARRRGRGWGCLACLHAWPEGAQGRPHAPQAARLSSPPRLALSPALAPPPLIAPPCPPAHTRCPAYRWLWACRPCKKLCSSCSQRWPRCTSPRCVWRVHACARARVCECVCVCVCAEQAPLPAMLASQGLRGSEGGHKH